MNISDITGKVLASLPEKKPGPAASKTLLKEIISDHFNDLEKEHEAAGIEPRTLSQLELNALVKKVMSTKYSSMLFGSDTEKARKFISEFMFDLNKKTVKKREMWVMDYARDPIKRARIESIASRIAAANPEVATAIASSIRDELGKRGKFNFGYDVTSISKTETGVLGQSEGYISFPARPEDFDKNNLNGTILIKLKLEPSISKNVLSLADLDFKAASEIGFYFKTPEIKGGGQYMFPRASVSIDIMFDADENPILMDLTQIDKLAKDIDSLTKFVCESPPKGAHSLTRDPQRRKQLREINEQARIKQKEEGEKAKAKELLEEKESENEFYSKTHGSIDAFVNYMDSIDEDIFGGQDVQKILDTMYPSSSAAQKGLMRNQIIQNLKEEGLVWDPKKTLLSSIAMKLSYR